MEKTKKGACINCGYIKPKPPKDIEKELYCGLCDEKYKLIDAKEHKNKNTHIIKNEIIKRVRELNSNDEEDKKKICMLSKSLIAKYKKGNEHNKNMLD